MERRYHSLIDKLLSRSANRVNSELWCSAINSLTMEAEQVLETSDYCYELMRLVAWKDSITFSCRENFKPYMLFASLFAHLATLLVGHVM
jgi:hypothetical protein